MKEEEGTDNKLIGSDWCLLVGFTIYSQLEQVEYFLQTIPFIVHKLMWGDGDSIWMPLPEMNGVVSYRDVCLFSGEYVYIRVVRSYSNVDDDLKDRENMQKVRSRYDT